MRGSPLHRTTPLVDSRRLDLTEWCKPCQQPRADVAALHARVRAALPDGVKHCGFSFGALIGAFPKMATRYRALSGHVKNLNWFNSRGLAGLELVLW